MIIVIIHSLIYISHQNVYKLINNDILISYKQMIQFISFIKKALWAQVFCVLLKYKTQM